MTQGTKKGILLMNLGSPDSTSVPDVRKYLDEFLMDPRVIDKPWLLRALLVKGIIVPFRAPKSAEAYKTIWTSEGSPLVAMTKNLELALQAEVDMPVTIAMRYGNPTPAEAFESLLKKQPALQQVIAVPLYPHYAMSSYETAVEHVRQAHRAKKYSFALSFVKPFYNDPYYLIALSEKIKSYLKNPYDHLLFSYHGIPERHVKKSDVTGCHCLQTNDCCNVHSDAHDKCYRHQVIRTTQSIARILQIPSNKYSISFQSRLGKGWLTPFTDIRLQEMPSEGIKNLLVVCPAFVSDCLETLEEIKDRGQKIFKDNGGETFTMIPCLNTDPLWVNAIASWVHNSVTGTVMNSSSQKKSAL
ncbi:MAG: ferrochelatase [Ginsengibacter sp.]